MLGKPITVLVVRWWIHGWEDMLVIVLTLDVGSLWSNVVEFKTEGGCPPSLLAAHQSHD